MHEVLVNCLFKLAQEKLWLGELTVPPWPKLLTWDVKQQNKRIKSNKQISWNFSSQPSSAKFNILAWLCSWAGWSYLVRNPKDRFSRVKADMSQHMRLWCLSHRQAGIAGINLHTVNVLKFRTIVACHKSRQTVETQIRLLLKKQSGQGLPCWLFWQAVCEFQPWKPTIYLRTEREKSSKCTVTSLKFFPL